MTEVENSPYLTNSAPEPDYTPPSLQEKHKYLNLLTKPDDPNYHIQINNNKYNNILTSLVNGLRRVIITDIPTISFDVESLSGFDNPNLQILENKSKLIELNSEGNFKQISFSGRLDYVPYLKPSQLERFYEARKKIYHLYEYLLMIPQL